MSKVSNITLDEQIELLESNKAKLVEAHEANLSTIDSMLESFRLMKETQLLDKKPKPMFGKPSKAGTVKAPSVKETGEAKLKVVKKPLVNTNKIENIFDKYTNRKNHAIK